MPPTHTPSWHRILDAIRDFETRMGGGNQRNGRELLTRTPPCMKPTRIRMTHLRAFYLAIRRAARSHGEEMAKVDYAAALPVDEEADDRFDKWLTEQPSPSPTAIAEDHLERLSDLLERAAASPLKPGATEEEKATVAKCFDSLRASVSRLRPRYPKGV